MELNDTEKQVLETLVKGRENDEPWGRANVQFIADETEYSDPHISTILRRLDAGGLVTRPYRHLYEITDEGIEAIQP